MRPDCQSKVRADTVPEPVQRAVPQPGRAVLVHASDLGGATGKRDKLPLDPRGASVEIDVQRGGSISSPLASDALSRLTLGAESGTRVAIGA